MNKRLHTANHQKVAPLVRLRNQCLEKAEGGRLQVEPILGYRVSSYLKTKQKQTQELGGFRKTNIVDFFSYRNPRF